MSGNSMEAADIRETVSRLLRGLEPYVPAILEGLATIGALKESLGAYAESLAPSLAALAPHFGKIGQIDWAEAKRRLDDLPAKSKDAMAVASSKGWFFGWDDSLRDVFSLVDNLGSIDTTEIDEFMSAYYRENLQFFTDRLVELHPERAPVIKAAVRAHNTLGSDGFILSVPVFIAQADGLLTKITQVKSAMMKAPGTDELQAAKSLRAQLNSDQKSLDLVSPILKLHELDFLKNSGQRRETEVASGQAFTALNRHQVMHGELWDYGTEINSLKAFSFLAFVGTHLPTVLSAAPKP